MNDWIYVNDEKQLSPLFSDALTQFRALHKKPTAVISYSNHIDFGYFRLMVDKEARVLRVYPGGFHTYISTDEKGEPIEDAKGAKRYY